MFNTYNRFESPERVDVHEHRAPTDKSVKLLLEMQKAATKSLLTSGVENVSADLLSWDVIYDHTGCRIWINLTVCGRKKEVEVPLSRFDFMEARSPELLCDKIQSRVMEKIVETIANELGLEFFRSAATDISKLILEKVFPR